MTTIAIATTIRASIQETVRYVDYHLRLGVDRMYMFFDDPEDPAIEVLSGHEPVTCIPCDEAHWERAKDLVRDATYALRLMANNEYSRCRCREEEIDWLVMIDADEFLYPVRPLKNVFEETRHDVMRFAVREAVAEGSGLWHPSQRGTLFRKPASGFPLRVARVLCPNAFFEGEYFRGHDVSKCAVRVSADVKNLGVHAPIDPDAVIEDTEAIKLLHYDAPEPESWTYKCRLRVQGMAKFLVRPNRHRQFEAFAVADRIGPEAVEKLYRRLYSIPKREQWVLRALGLAERVKVGF